MFGHERDAIAFGGDKIDFGGSLRRLKAHAGFYQLLLQPLCVDFDSLAGLQELELDDCHRPVGDRSNELFQVIAPTLEKLTIKYSDPPSITRNLPLLNYLSQLSIQLEEEEDPAPLLHSLPDSLPFLRLSSYIDLQPILLRWFAEPSLVPASLKHIQIDVILEEDTFRQLPSIDR